MNLGVKIPCAHPSVLGVRDAQASGLFRTDVKEDLSAVRILVGRESLDG